MKRLDFLLLNLCVFPSYVWYVRRIVTGGEEVISVLLLPVCIMAAWKAKIQSKDLLDYRTLAGATLYVVLWGIGAPAIVKAAVAIWILLYATGCLPHFGVSALGFLSLPWLSSFQYFFGFPLRKVVVEGASLTLNAFGLPVYASGTGLAFQGSQVFVDPPCSGVRMIWAVLFLSAILCVLFKTSWQKGVLTCTCGVLLAVLGNIVRATILFFPESELVQWPDWTHETVGVAAYLGICVALFMTLKLINNEPQTTYTHYANS